MKNCSYIKCKQINPQSLDNFYSRPDRKSGKQSRCKYCQREEKLLPENKKRSYLRNLKENHNLTQEKHEELMKKQNYLCGICNKHQNESKRFLHIDHNHITGKIRGLLCYKCNYALGLLKADMGIELFQNAIKYLIKG